MSDAQQPSPGLTTPPLASPRPIQTQATDSSSPSAAEDSSWKVVGSPPRGQLLPSHDDRTKKAAAMSSGAEDDDEHWRSNGVDSGIASASLAASKNWRTPRENTDTAPTKSASTYASVTTRARDSVSSSWAPPSSSSSSTPVRQQNVVQTPSTPSPQALTGSTSSASPSQVESLRTDPAPATTTTASSIFQRGQDLSLGLLEISAAGSRTDRQLGSNGAFHAGSHEPNSLNGSITGAGKSLEHPLTLSSFIWSDREGNSDGANPSSTLALPMSGKMTASRHDTVAADNQFFSMSAALSADPFVPTRPTRSFSLSEPVRLPPGFADRAFADRSNNGRHTAYGKDDGDALGLYRAQLPTMEEESEDAFDSSRVNRTRSYSTSAAFGSEPYHRSLSSTTFAHPLPRDPFAAPTAFPASPLGLSQNQDQHPFLNRKLSVGSTWPSVSHHSIDNNRTMMPLNHRRSVTAGSYVSPIWEALGDQLPPAPPVSEREHVERMRLLRRFSVAPSSGFQTYDRFLESEYYGGPATVTGYNRGTPAENEFVYPQRRHSVAGPSGSYFQPGASPFSLTSSLESLRLEDRDATNTWNLNEEYDQEEYQHSQSSSSGDMTRGMTLSQLSQHGSLYVVEFKAGRSDLFYVADSTGLSFKCGDLVMVEADRGKDLGKIIKDSITAQQVQKLQKEQAEAAAVAAQQDSQRAPKEIHPKRIFRLAHASEIAQLASKGQDEIKAMMVCQTKVRQKKLPMEVVDAEYQWDRRKLTFYFQAEHRIDFRELVRDLFKIYKTRIWMYAVNASMMAALGREIGSNAGAVQVSSPRLSASPSASPSPQPLSVIAHSPQQQQQQQQQQLQQQAPASPLQILPQQHQYQQQPHASNQSQTQYQHQPQLQDLMRQMQAQYFSAPQHLHRPQQHRQHHQAMHQAFQHHHHHHHHHHNPNHHHPGLEEEPMMQHRPFYEQSYPLQPPHPLM